MVKRSRVPFLLLVVGVLLGLSVAATRPYAEEPASENDPPTVTEAEFNLYVNIYTAMQDDHGLTIDQALQPRGVSLEDFRHIERRIQADAHMTERVRQVLAEHAKGRALFSQVGTPTPAGALPPPAAPPNPRR